MLFFFLGVAAGGSVVNRCMSRQHGQCESEAGTHTTCNSYGDPTGGSSYSPLDRQRTNHGRTECNSVHTVVGDEDEVVDSGSDGVGKWRG